MKIGWRIWYKLSQKNYNCFSCNFICLSMIVYAHADTIAPITIIVMHINAICFVFIFNHFPDIIYIFFSIFFRSSLCFIINPLYKHYHQKCDDLIKILIRFISFICKKNYLNRSFGTNFSSAIDNN